MRDTSRRRERIVSMLKDKGSVQVPDLAELFHVSTVTIRKDLKFLDNQGIAVRAYGGAILNEVNLTVAEKAIDQKQALHALEKSSIGKAAAQLIESGDSLILDSGTTTLQIAAHLGGKKDITVVTNGLNVMNELSRYEHLNLLMLGGTLRMKNMSFFGSQAEQALADLHVDKLFLGVDGFHMDRGITTHFEAEALLNRLMCNAASEVIVVADSSKFGSICLHKILEPNLVSKVVTDSNIPRDYRDRLARLGVELVLSDN